MWGNDFSDLDSDKNDGMLIIGDDEPSSSEQGEMVITCTPIRPRFPLLIVAKKEQPPYSVTFKAIPQVMRLIEEAEVGEVREFKSPMAGPDWYILTPHSLYLLEDVVTWLESFRIEE